VKLRYAKRIDFTGDVEGFEHFDAFGPAAIEAIRAEGRSPMVIIVDKGFGFSEQYVQPHLIIDHINLTGDNPLVGPNDPIGPRFPVVNNVYLAAADTMDQEETWSIGNPLGKIRNGIVAGVKHGVKLNDEELAACHKLGAGFYCYNMVPAMIIAAHAGLKVLGIVVPDGQKPSADILRSISR